MGNQRKWQIIFIWLSLEIYLYPCVGSSIDNLPQSFDVIFHDHAFRTLIHRLPRTGALYNASPPADLYAAGIKVSVVRFRSKTLWKKGANFSGFTIPPGTLPVPHSRRLLIVYHDLGNLSSLYFNLPGYSLLTSVVGFMMYDASHLSSQNITKLELDLDTKEKNISIQFHALRPLGTGVSRCAAIDSQGRVRLSDNSVPNVCYTKSEGHFSIVVPVQRKQQIWEKWVIGCVSGIIALVLGCFIGIFLVRHSIVKQNHQQQRGDTDGSEALNSHWINSSKMPCAVATRTHPMLENASVP